MKEIIEKYKKGELRVRDCSHRIKFRDGDVIRNVYNDKSSETKVEDCVADIPIGISNCNTNLGYTNPNYFVATCAALDKEIAAMEKQPEYDFEQVTDSIFDLKDEFEARDIYKNCISTFDVIATEGELLDEYLNGALFRRVEITPEQKREREVEGLAREMHEADVKRGEFSVASEWDAIEVWEENSYISHAKKAIEWMESKK